MLPEPSAVDVAVRWDESDRSYPGRSYRREEQGYTYAVEVDLSQYFDTLNHELLMNLLRRQVQDKRVTKLIKRYLKSGVMEHGVVCQTEKGSPQGGPLSPLLANIYLNEYDQEMERRGVKTIRYATEGAFTFVPTGNP